MFELSLRTKPTIVSFDPRKRNKLAWGKSVGSDGQAIAIYEEGVGASGDVHMRDTESEDGGQEAADGDNESEEKMDDDNEQEPSECEVHEGDEMNAFAEQVASDEEEDDISELVGINSEGEDSGEEWEDSEDEAIPLITEDCSQIFDPDSMSFIPIPTDLADKRKALLGLFLFYTPFDYLDDGCKIDANVIIRRFPNNLWWSTFTRDETSKIVEEQEKRFMNGILARSAQVMAQWQDRPGFPAIPDTRTEIELAKTNERSLERKAYFKLLLRHRNTRQKIG
jgi:hypothetical protein